MPDARPLADLLANGWRPERAEALRLLRGVADALDHAHGQGIVHGDLEPATVLVAADGSALVAHFGLARLVGAAPLPGGTGLRYGSPAHVAPERVVAGALGPPADVYALAVIAHQLLTGAVPTGTPEDAVLRRGLDRDPDARWPTAGELVDALEAEPVEAARSGLPPRVEPPSPRIRLGPFHPTRTSVAAVFGLLLLAGLPVAILVGGRTGPADPAAATRTPSPEASQPAPFVAVSPPDGTPTPEPPAPGPSPSPARPRPSPTVRPSVAPSLVAAPPSPLPSPSASQQRSISVSDSKPFAGQQDVQVTGHGFDPAQQYVLYFVQGGSIVQVFGPASPRGNGDFVNPIRIPTTAQPGSALLAGCVYIPSTRTVTGQCAATALSVHR
jgi:serine/threonine protein kinase